MKRLDLILNGKGGVGKSFFATNLVAVTATSAAAVAAASIDLLLGHPWPERISAIEAALVHGVHVRAAELIVGDRLAGDELDAVGGAHHHGDGFDRVERADRLIGPQRFEIGGAI